MKKIQEIQVQVTIPADIVKAVITAQKRVNAKKEPDEYAARLVIAEWIQSQIDTEMEIWQEIVDAYHVPTL